MTVSPAIAPGPPPPDPMGKIDPDLAPDEAGCMAGCCGLATALWALPVTGIAALAAGNAVGDSLAWAAFFAGLGACGVPGAWAGAKSARGPKARHRLIFGGGVAAGLFVAGALAFYLASKRAEAEAPPDTFFAGLFEMLLALACLPPAAGGAALALGALAFLAPASKTNEPADPGSLSPGSSPPDDAAGDVPP